MYAPEPQQLLHYKISTEADGVRLRIWEMATGPRAAPKTYLYIINYRFTSLDEAKAQLCHHLSLNGGVFTQEHTIPNRGQIRLIPHPTLEY
jgi:hypothetical protein